MKVFSGFEAFSKAIDVFPLAGGTYAKPKINKNTIMNAEFVIFPDMDVDDTVDEKGEQIPVQIAGQGYVEWLEAPMVKAIILHKQEMNPQAGVEELVDAVFHYLEYDNFQGQ